MSNPDAELITMREAARRLGMVSANASAGEQARAANRLRRMLEARQAERGIRVVVQAVNRRRRCVTLNGIRAALPELRRAPRQIDELRKWLATIEERIDERCLAIVEPRLAELADADEALAAAARILRRDLDRVSRTLERVVTATGVEL